MGASPSSSAKTLLQPRNSAPETPPPRLWGLKEPQVPVFGLAGWSSRERVAPPVGWVPAGTP